MKIKRGRGLRKEKKRTVFHFSSVCLRQQTLKITSLRSVKAKTEHQILLNPTYICELLNSQ